MSDQQSQGLSLLLSLQHEVRKLTTVRDFGFFVVNETIRMLPYNNAVLWEKRPGLGVHLLSISGVANVDATTPFNQWLLRLTKHYVEDENKNTLHVIHYDSVDYDLQRDWPVEAGKEVLWAPFTQEEFDSNAGMIFIRRQNWTEAEANRLNWLIQSYAYTWNFLTKTSQVGSWWRNIIKHKRNTLISVVVVILVILFFPVHQTVVAPAEVVARDPTIVTAPLEGVIKDLEVKPNQKVTKGQALFRMDDTDLESNYKLAKQELMVTQEQYQRAVQRGFREPESRAEVNILQATLKEKRTQMAYSKALLDRSVVRAPSSGIVIFGHVNDWKGKPVATGEKVMEIARPNQVEMEIWLPVSDGLDFEDNATVKLYLTGQPLNSLNGKLMYTSYDAALTPTNVLSYRLIAQFDKDQELPRIGLQGSAKVYGNRTVLIYYVLRRPLSSARQTLGW